METARASFKLEEVQFFLNHLRQEEGKDARAFGFYLSAFLNAAYSMSEQLKREAKTELKKGAVNKRQSKAKYDAWLDQWLKRLSEEETEEYKVWQLMEHQRHAEVHDIGAKTVGDTKAVAVRPRDFRSVYYLQGFVPPPAQFADAWLEERRRLGLPLWANVWWEAQVHHFEIEGERREVVSMCKRYVVLLQRLLEDFHRSDLASAS